MKSPENVIISLNVKDTMLDYEVPVFATVELVHQKIEESLRVLHPEWFLAGDHLREFRFNDSVLDDQRTLASYGIWDGSVVNGILEATANDLY